MSHASLVAAVLVALAAPRLEAQEWPSFRGAGARGVADEQGLPADWDLKSGRRPTSEP